MDELELPPIFVRKEPTPPPLSSLTSAGISSGLKRTASEAGLEGGIHSASGDQVSTLLNVFSLSLTAGSNKLERLSLANVKNFVRP